MSIVSEDAVPALAVQAMRKINGGTVGVSGSSGGGASSGGSSGGGVSLKRKATGIRKEGDDRQDKRRRKDDDGAHYGSKFCILRMNSYLCYAWSRATGHWYVGYSGGASDVTSIYARGNDRARRENRVRPVVGGTTERMGRNIFQCAEVAALNVALSYGESAADLVFITFSGHHNGIVDPCNNCIQWISAYCWGYFDRNGILHQYR
jgi:hypothetical protein